MKRRTLHYFLYLTATLFVLLHQADVVDAAEPRVAEVASDTYVFIGIDGGANSGFIVTEEGVVVIDTQGPADLALLLKNKIRKVTNKPILYIINTHFHGDHSFGNQHFKEAKAIIAHRNARKELIEKKEEHIKNFARFFGEERSKDIVLTLPTIIFEKYMSIYVGGVKLELFYLGRGHTSGDIVIYLPEKKVLFGGDLIYQRRLPWVNDGDTFDWIDTLNRLEPLEADVVVPGHGGIGGKELLSVFKGYLKDLHEEVGRLKDKGISLEELMKEIELPEYRGYLKYREWLPFNAKKVYMEIEERD
jgi:cyclase